ncbi:hypothetical protein C8Q75DRAFT_764648 [Abortiporus biennis]|nr:hypothetical protein C8Q75DRAFT_764648 [Abortiporus biennis]
MDIVEGTTYFHKHRSAALLDTSHVAVCSTVEENDADVMLVITIIDLERMRRGLSLRDSTLILELPAPVDSTIIQFSWCNVWHDYLGPEGRWYPCPPGSPLKHPAFEYRNDNAILGFSWHYTTGPDGPYRGRGDYKGYVPIFRLIEWSLGEKRTLKWEEWGAYSRIFEGDFEIYRGTNYGSKAIIASWEDEHDERVVMNSKRWYEFVDFDTTFGGNDKHQLGNAAEYVTTPTEIVPIVPMTCGERLVSGSLLPYRRYPLKLSPHPIDVGGQDPPTAATTGCSILVEHLQASGWSIYSLDYSADS